MNWGNNRLDTEERGLNKPEDRAVEISQNAAYKDKISKQRQEMQTVEEDDPSCLLWILEGKKEREAIFKHIAAKKFPSSIEDT